MVNPLDGSQAPLFKVQTLIQTNLTVTINEYKIINRLWKIAHEEFQILYKNGPKLDQIETDFKYKGK